jgi:hypothetical protein
MRPTWTALLLGLASCSGAAPAAEPETPAAWAALLGSPDPERREEAAAAISIRGLTLGEAAGGRSLARSAEDAASLRAGIREALAEAGPERMVRHAYHRLRLGCLARDAKSVSVALDLQGFRLIEIYEPNGGVKFTRYLAQPGAYADGTGDRHDLFCWTRADRRADGLWLVREVYAGLVAKFDAPFRTVASSGRFPPGSVLGRFFELPELRKLALVFPVLEELEFTYGRIRTRESDAAPAGFHVNAGFVMEGKAGGRSIYYTAECGLDPLERRGGRLEWDGFAPSDAVGPLLPRGSGVWGAGGLKPVQDD